MTLKLHTKQICRTQTARNSQTFADCFAPAGLRMNALSTDHTELILFLSHGVLLDRTQTAQKAQTFARAALVLACIAGYFSRTQNTRNSQNGCIV